VIVFHVAAFNFLGKTQSSFLSVMRPHIGHATFSHEGLGLKTQKLLSSFWRSCLSVWLNLTRFPSC
jgi:hypothetical protein